MKLNTTFIVLNFVMLAAVVAAFLFVLLQFLDKYQDRDRTRRIVQATCWQNGDRAQKHGRRTASL